MRKKLSKDHINGPQIRKKQESQGAVTFLPTQAIGTDKYPRKGAKKKGDGAQGKKRFIP